MAGEKKYNGGYALPTGTVLKSAEPWDSRIIVKTLDSLKTLQYCYPWIEVTVDSDGKKYKWNGLDQTNLVNWIELNKDTDLSTRALVGGNENETFKVKDAVLPSEAVSFSQMIASLPDDSFSQFMASMPSILFSGNGQYHGNNTAFGVHYSLAMSITSDLELLRKSLHLAASFTVSKNSYLSSIIITGRHNQFQADASFNLVIIKNRRIHGIWYSIENNDGVILCNAESPILTTSTNQVYIEFGLADFLKDEDNLPLTLNSGDSVYAYVIANSSDASKTFEIHNVSMLYTFKNI